MVGFRCWTLLSRHSSVVRIVPFPLTSIEPPSITTRVLPDSGRISRAWAEFAIRLPIFSSWRQLEYLAQALKRNLRARMFDSRSCRLSWAPAPAPQGRFRKMQPESRSQERFVGQRWKRTFLTEA